MSRSSVIDTLVSLGWEHQPGPAVARKVFATEVGSREAFAYLHMQGGFWCLRGTYWSEGINALAPFCRLIPATACYHDVTRAVKDFAQDADAAIDGTYARSLLLRYPDTALT